MSTQVALVFPGQGSQYVGMGKNLEGTPGFDLFNQASEVLGFNLRGLMFEGPDEQLKLTENTQPAIVAHSLALLENLRPVLKGHNVSIAAVAGHSVGEYAALAAAGVLSSADAIRLVNARGKFMQAAVPVGIGTMYALLKLEQAVVEQACLEASMENEVVTPANFNDPSQIVISGHVNACKRAVDWLKENVKDPHRAIELNVSAPFHSPLMEPAALQMAALLESTSFSPNHTPYIANIDATVYEAQTSVGTIRTNLVAQIAGSVRWTQSILKLAPDTLCIEVGPGKVLAGLIRKINPALKVVSLDKEGAMSELEEALS
jgi:[acyl-carrier-protein] S-malonyltransferase